MSTKTVKVPNITCGHCVMTIKRELSDLDGLSSVEGDADSKMITVTWQPPATWETINALLKEINYPPEA